MSPLEEFQQGLEKIKAEYPDVYPQTDAPKVEQTSTRLADQSRQLFISKQAEDRKKRLNS